MFFRTVVILKVDMNGFLVVVEVIWRGFCLLLVVTEADNPKVTLVDVVVARVLETS